MCEDGLQGQHAVPVVVLHLVDSDVVVLQHVLLCHRCTQGFRVGLLGWHALPDLCVDPLCHRLDGVLVCGIKGGIPLQVLRAVGKLSCQQVFEEPQHGLVCLGADALHRLVVCIEELQEVPVERQQLGSVCLLFLPAVWCRRLVDQRVVQRPALCLCPMLLERPPVLHEVQVVILLAIVHARRLAFLFMHQPLDFFISLWLLVIVLSVNCSSGPEPGVELLSGADCEVACHLDNACGHWNDCSQDEAWPRHWGECHWILTGKLLGMTAIFCRDKGRTFVHWMHVCALQRQGSGARGGAKLHICALDARLRIAEVGPCCTFVH